MYENVKIFTLIRQPVIKSAQTFAQLYAHGQTGQLNSYLLKHRRTTIN